MWAAASLNTIGTSRMTSVEKPNQRTDLKIAHFKKEEKKALRTMIASGREKAIDGQAGQQRSRVRTRPHRKRYRFTPSEICAQTMRSVPLSLKRKPLKRKGTPTATVVEFRSCVLLLVYTKTEEIPLSKGMVS
jgi:hypothetical protein